MISLRSGFDDHTGFLLSKHADTGKSHNFLFKEDYHHLYINTLTVQSYNKILAATQSVRICQFSIARKRQFLS